MCSLYFIFDKSAFKKLFIAFRCRPGACFIEFAIYMLNPFSNVIFDTFHPMHKHVTICKHIYTVQATFICDHSLSAWKTGSRVGDHKAHRKFFLLLYFSFNVRAVILAWRDHLHPALAASISWVNVNKDLSVQRLTALHQVIWKRTESPVIQQHKIFKSHIIDFWKAYCSLFQGAFTDRAHTGWEDFNMNLGPTTYCIYTVNGTKPFLSSQVESYF